MSYSIGNRISSGSFGDVYKIKTHSVKTENSSDEEKSSFKHKENYALKVIQNTHYGVKCLTELFILLFFNYSYIMNCYQFHIDLKERMTKILMPLAICDLKSGLLKYIKNKIINKIDIKTKNKEKYIDINILWQIVCSLGFLHSKGIVHGDIKPSNILLMGDKIKLTDFSLSTFHINENHRINLKESYTENYRPPEVWKSEGYSYKGDIWALGCTFHEIVYSKKYIIDIVSKDLQEEENVLFKDLLEKMLNLNENERYSVWDVINHDYFKEFDKNTLGFQTNYPRNSLENKGFESEEDFIKKLSELISVYEDIPKYVYDIIAMKLFRRDIDKSYFKYLNIFYIEYETKIIELLWNKKLGFELFK